jgi:hypothetical protein
MNRLQKITTQTALLVIAVIVINRPFYDSPSTEESIAAEQVNSPGGGLGGDR